MHLLGKFTNNENCSSGFAGRITKAWSLLGACLLTLGLSSPATADEIEIFNFDFETDPPNFFIGVQIFPEGADASGSLEIGDVGGSTGLIYKGTFQTKPGVTELEFANGLYFPAPPTFEDYHLYPDEVDGINSISVFIDGIVDGLPGDVNSLGRMGFFFSIWQPGDGVFEVYELNWIFENADWADIGMVNLTAEDFRRASDNAIPDFSPTAPPISFGLAVGIGYAWVSGPNGQVINTSARLDNWRVTADVGQTVFEDGFEPNEVEVPNRLPGISDTRSCNGEICAQASFARPGNDDILSRPPER